MNIVEEGSISGAAKKLNMTQPPISSQMQLLEKELDCILFTRGQRKITLTEEGSLLYERALEMLHLSKSTIATIKDCQKTNGGTLRIGIVSSVIDLSIQTWLHPFQEKYTETNFEIYEANTYELMEMLNSKIIDVALVRTPFSGRDFHCISAEPESLVAVFTKNYGLSKDNVTLKDLSNYPLILYRRWSKIIDEKFAEQGLSTRIICMANDARTCISFATHEFGIALVPISIYHSTASDCLMYKTIEDMPMQSSVTLILSKNGCDTYVGKSFVNYFKHTLHHE